MEIVLKIVLVCALVTVFAIIAHFVDVVRKNNINNKMSFKESMDLCELPIVTFLNNGKKLNFLLDTGASGSIIDSNILEGLIFTKLDKIGDIFGMEGNKQEVSYINMALNYKDVDYDDDFQVMNMSAPFGNLKSDYGVNVHGVLSSSFFQKYKYILDFNELVAYSRT